MRSWLANAKTNEDIRYRLSVASRVLAAFVGGYAFTSAVTVLLALLWPLPKAEAIYAADMLSFTLYVLVLIWAFSVRRVRVVWLGMFGGAAVFALLALALLPTGAVA
ncbi:MAG: hypothetical protein QM808_12485 [Steroidobacteraceae bacterium]